MQVVKKWLTNSDPDLVSRFFAEFLGCMVFHFIGSAAPTALVNGATLTAMVHLTAKISGAHLNPAVSLTFTALGHTNPAEMLVYWMAQVLGCATGAAWLLLMTPPNHPSDGCFVSNTELTGAQVFGWEAITTFSFILTVFSVVWYTQNKTGYAGTGPLIIGIALAANAAAATPYTGGALNPARLLASPIVFKCPVEPLYIAGEMAASLLAALVVIPFYGVSENAWYRLPNVINTVAARSTGSIILKTSNEHTMKR